MQRRAAAMYFAFFVVVGAAAYGLIVTMSAPHISMSGDAYQQGDPVTLNGQTYNVSRIAAVSGGGGGHGGGGGGVKITGKLARVDEDARLTETLDNGSEVPAWEVSWEGQRALNQATLENGSTIPFNASQYRVAVNASASTLTLTDVENANVSESFETGDTLTYRDNETTLISVTESAATLAWGGPYIVDVNNESVANPTNATLVEQRDYEALATEDPALYNETIRQNGVLKVTYRSNETNVPVEEYFGPKERHRIAENGTLTYNGNETTVSEITNESVELTWVGPKTKEIDLAEGENFTAGPENDQVQYFAHFPDNSSVKIFQADQRYDEYASQKAEISSFESRKLGLWGVAEISALAAIILLMSAYLPTRG